MPILVALIIVENSLGFYSRQNLFPIYFGVKCVINVSAPFISSAVAHFVLPLAKTTPKTTENIKTFLYFTEQTLDRYTYSPQIELDDMLIIAHTRIWWTFLFF